MPDTVSVDKKFYLDLLAQTSEKNFSNSEKFKKMKYSILNAGISLIDGTEMNASCISNFLTINEIKHSLFVWLNPEPLPITVGKTFFRAFGNIPDVQFLPVEVHSSNVFIRDDFTIYPIMLQDKLVSLLIYQTEDISKEDSEIIKLAVRTTMQATTLFEHAAFVMDMTKAKANIDTLMSIKNPTCFESEYTSYKPLHVAVMDIDRFKVLNDTYGHSTGDKVLKEYGAILGSLTNRNTTPYRHGGDEVIVLSDNEENFVNFLETLRNIMKDYIFYDELEREIKCTLSIGAALRCPSIELGRAWADFSMYEVKQSGRDNIKIVTCGETIPDISTIKKGVDDRI